MKLSHAADTSAVLAAIRPWCRRAAARRRILRLRPGRCSGYNVTVRKRNRQPPVLAPALALACGLVAACTPVSKSFEVNSGELISCEEANRFVFETVVSMDMEVTAFSKARPGVPGKIVARSANPANKRAGEVVISCEADGVHIDPRQFGLDQDMSFERGLFLGITGRAGLLVGRGVIKGRRGVPSPAGAAVSAAEAGAMERARASILSSHDAGARGDAAGSAAVKTLPGSGGRATALAKSRGSSPPAVAKPPVSRGTSGGFSVELQPQRGFATVLDFEADVSAAGILPIKIRVRNEGSNIYEFDPADVVVRVRGSRSKAKPLSVREAVARLRAAGGSGKNPDIGDVAAAARIIEKGEIRAARLPPGAQLSGYLYYAVGDYDRATLRVVDVATGETEGFMIQF